MQCVAKPRRIGEEEQMAGETEQRMKGYVDEFLPLSWDDLAVKIATHTDGVRATAADIVMRRRVAEAQEKAAKAQEEAAKAQTDATVLLKRTAWATVALAIATFVLAVATILLVLVTYLAMPEEEQTRAATIASWLM
jgi:hypothetical protein